MSDVKTYKKGVDAEAKCARYLEELGYNILDMRYKTKFGEVDIIATCGNTLVFTEVKARKSYENGVYAITEHQKRRIMDTASIFIYEHPDYHHSSLRFDAVIVDDNSNLTHIPNAWR